MRALTLTLLALTLAVAACGTKSVDTAKYTCAEFNKSLHTDGDDSAGTFINALRKQAKLGQGDKKERSELTQGIVLACRGKPGSTKPGLKAIAVAKAIRKKSSE